MSNIYRAKRLDNNEWVYWTTHGKLITTQRGKLVSGNIGFTDWIWELLTDDSTQSCSVGKKDKAGREIFGGDILRHYNNPWAPESFALGVVEWDEKNFRWVFHNLHEGRLYNVGSQCTYEIIGNIVDHKITDDFRVAPKEETGRTAAYT